MTSDPKLEHKFIAHRAMQDAALRLLQHSCLPDPQYPEGTIRSIYYDTRRLHAFEEKADGMFLKDKLRLRWYGGNGELATAFLEFKGRTGLLRSKHRKALQLNRSWLESTPLCSPQLHALPFANAVDLQAPVPLDLVPVVDVAYERLRFLCPVSHARVSLDVQLRTERFNSHILPGTARLDGDVIVLEVKDVLDPALPWLRALHALGFRRAAFSKYAASVSAITHGEPA